jgi:hypothetical protein
VHLDLCNKTHKPRDKILRDIPARISFLVISTPKHLHAGDSKKAFTCGDVSKIKNKNPIL